MNPTTIIVLAVVIILLLITISTYNKLVRLKNRVENQWSQISIQLKRRADLIPNLVEVVKGYAKHEREAFKEVIEARNTYLNATSVDEAAKSESLMQGALKQVFALAENYPELKANTNFLDLQNQLKDIEDKISYARQFYNDTVNIYNDAVAMFPSNIFATIFNFKKANLFELTNPKDAENIKIQF